MTRTRPPVIARTLLRLLVRDQASEFIVGDLEEDYRRTRQRRGNVAARRWYWHQVLSSIAARSTARVRKASPKLNIPASAGDSMLETMLRDLRYAFRSIAQQPGFAALVVLTLALGIGANTAIFSVVNAVLLRALPYPAPDRLAVVFETIAEDPANAVPTSYLTYQDWRDNESFEEMAILAAFNTMVLSGEDDAVRLQVTMASSSYFSLLGARPAEGRLFITDDDGVPDQPAIAVLSHGLWQRRFGGDPGIVGQNITLSAREYAVVGVMMDGFADLYSASQQTDVWIPQTMATHVISAQALELRYVRRFQVLGRLRQGVTIEAAQMELDAIAAAIQEVDPAVMADQGAVVTPLRQRLVGFLNAPLMALLTGAGILLLVGCINVASLMLVRGTRRGREVAIRQALGASRGQLIRQLTTETMLLAALGGVGGVVLAYLSIDLLMSMSAVALPYYVTVGIDGVVLVSSVALAILTGLVVGLAPAIRSTGTDLRAKLVETDLRSGGSRNRLPTNALVVLEVATAMVLMVGSGLMIRSFQELRGTEIGFRTDNVMTVQVSLQPLDYPTKEAVVQFRHTLVERLEAQPGVDFAVTWGPGTPGTAASFTTAVPEGTVVESQLDANLARAHEITAGALGHLELQLLAGRAIDESDRIGTQPAAVISESLANALWPDEDPIGQRLGHFRQADRDPADYPAYEVVGVVADASLGGRLFGSRGGSFPTLNDLYFTYEHRSIRNAIDRFAVMVGTSGDPAALTDTIRSVIHSIDPNVPVFNPLTLETAVGQELTLSRFTAVLMGLFGSISLFLAAIGIYGVLSQSVAARTREIGVRKALGAQTRATVRLFLSYGMRLVLLGVALGLTAALGLTRFAASLLFGITPNDPLTLVTTAALLVGVALLACYIPTRRALRVDPVVSLRTD